MPQDLTEKEKTDLLARFAGSFICESMLNCFKPKQGWADLMIIFEKIEEMGYDVTISAKMWMAGEIADTLSLLNVVTITKFDFNNGHLGKVLIAEVFYDHPKRKREAMFNAAALFVEWFNLNIK